jgi:hypothetical protein
MPETYMTFATIEDTSMEVGRNKYGFYYWVTHKKSGYDSIWVIVDHFSKVGHFIPVNTTYKGAKLVEI